MTKEDLLKKNERLLFKLDLALESYVDDTSNTFLLLKEATKQLNEYRKEKNNLDLNQQLKTSKQLLKKYNDVLDIIGKDKFIFYEDGDIEYIWGVKMSKGSNRDWGYASYDVDNPENENLPSYGNVRLTFDILIGSLATSTVFEDYKNCHEKYKEILLKIVEWSTVYEKTKDLSFIQYTILLDIYNELQELKCNNIYTSDSELSDKIVIWYWNLMLLRKAQIETKEGKTMEEKYINNTMPSYANINETFIKLIGYLNLILYFDAYKDDFDEYKYILSIITEWAVEYEKTRKLEFINNDILISIYEKSDELQTKYICNDKVGSESEFSDYIVNLIWQLRVIYKNYIKGVKK